MEAVENQIRESAGMLLRDLVLFDVFEGKSLPEGKKSLAFTLDLNSTEKTLTEEEGSRVVDTVVKEVCGRFSAELRSS
jgi:phenylalanyl-tRNA synthetase beta chain